MRKYDLVVIGAGSGGMAAAICAHEKGLKVAILEKHKLGGECLHLGCIPSKAFLHSSRMYEATKHLKRDYGLDGLDISWNLNFSAVMERAQEVIQRIYEKETQNFYQHEGIDVYINRNGANFNDAHSISIGSDLIHFKHAIICTGSSPKKLTTNTQKEIDFLDNENFWLLRELPESVIFIGGGVVSAELGQALARFGSKITIVDSHSEILHSLDKDVRKTITSIFKEEGISIIGNAKLKEIRKEEKAIAFDPALSQESNGETVSVVTYLQGNKEKEIHSERIFIAVGRIPNIEGLGLEKAGVEYTDSGIQINDFHQTSVDHIFACGDVASALKFTHTAVHQAEICIENILHEHKKTSQVTPVPWAVFTDPEIAHVGLSETEARKNFGDEIHIAKVDTTADRFMTDSNTTGFLKVIFDSDQFVIGGDAIGTHAGEWIQLLTFAINNQISAEDLSNTIFAYPTYSEIVKKACKQFMQDRSKLVEIPVFSEHEL